MGKEQFNIEYQYQLYLKRIGLREDSMHPQQKKQLKEAFFGATGQILVLLREGVGDLEEDDAVNVLNDMETQVLQFFVNKINKN